MSNNSNSNLTVLVTGASGFIVQHCIIELLKRGFNVRGTVRDLSKAAAITTNVNAQVAGEIDFYEAELQTPASWEAAVKGCDYVLHVASPFPLQQPTNPDDLTKPAVEGTVNVLKACSLYGIKRVVVTSSIASIMAGHKYDDRPAVWDETFWSNLDNTMSPYERSKTMAEKALWKFVDDNPSDMEVVTVCPGAVIGPGMDAKLSTSIEIVKQLVSGEIPACPKIGWPLVDVRDVAWLHVESMLHPDAAGNRYCAVNGSLWLSDIASVLRPRYKPQGYKVPSIEMPNWVVKFASYFMSDLKAFKSSLGLLGNISNAKAQKELAWKPVELNQSIIDTAESLIKLGVVKAS